MNIARLLLENQSSSLSRHAVVKSLITESLLPMPMKRYNSFVRLACHLTLSSQHLLSGRRWSPESKSWPPSRIPKDINNTKGIFQNIRWILACLLFGKYFNRIRPGKTCWLLTQLCQDMCLTGFSQKQFIDINTFFAGTSSEAHGLLRVCARCLWS